jgi:endogenous inhibitor of DNA gyrase (YacG/DUF329 family)
MNYEKIYESIITRAKHRVLECYTEKHHILPRCMDGGDEIENIAILTPEEHYVAHQLLVKIHPKHYGVIKAVHMMTVSANNQIRNNKSFGWIRRKWIIALRGQRAARIIKQCKYCQANITGTYAELKNVSYCTIDCRSAFKTLQGTKIIICSNCQKSVQVKKSRHNVKFCSKECADVSRRFIFKCPVCNVEKTLRTSERYYKTCSTECGFKLKKQQALS